MKRIILTILILSLTMGCVVASEVDNFKVPDTFSPLKGGEAINVVDSSIRINVWSFTPEDFATDEDFEMTQLDNNTYKCYDKIGHSYTAMEKISVNGKDYTVSVGGKTDFDNLLGFLNQFNIVNNVEPVSV